MSSRREELQKAHIAIVAARSAVEQCSFRRAVHDNETDEDSAAWAYRVVIIKLREAELYFDAEILKNGAHW